MGLGLGLRIALLGLWPRLWLARDAAAAAAAAVAAAAAGAGALGLWLWLRLRLWLWLSLRDWDPDRNRVGPVDAVRLPRAFGTGSCGQSTGLTL